MKEELIKMDGEYSSYINDSDEEDDEFFKPSSSARFNSNSNSNSQYKAKFSKELTRVLETIENKKAKLLKEGKPQISMDFPRLL